MKIIIVSICLLLVGCSMVDVSEQTPLKGMSVDEAWEWIDDNIEFKFDFIDDFQLPNTTYKLRTGDCEDFSILLMSVMNSQSSNPPSLVMIRHNQSIHYVVKWNGEYYESQVPNMKYGPEYIRQNYILEESYSYCLSISH